MTQEIIGYAILGTVLICAVILVTVVLAALDAMDHDDDESGPQC